MRKQGNHWNCKECWLILAGIYIHIPFCKTKCHYCDFYKTTDFGARYDFQESLLREIMLRATECLGESVESVYLGGGTPSVLKVEEISRILGAVYDNYEVADDVEITVEGNPDDLTDDYLADLRQTNVNRLSIGIQSFDEGRLRLMNRRHNAEQARRCAGKAKDAGFTNISIDLIYGLPDMSVSELARDIEKAIGMEVSHISAYHLTYHKGTVFYNYLKSGKLTELSDEQSHDQFMLLKSCLESAGYEHYEISNFARKGLRSRHNMSYWTGERYLGFGPSAHSYDRETRRWNVSSLNKYISNIRKGDKYWQEEILSPRDKYNDFIITTLRTAWGVSEKALLADFESKYVNHFLKEIKTFIDSGHVLFSEGSWRLTAAGLFISDRIMLALSW